MGCVSTTEVQQDLNLVPSWNGCALDAPRKTFHQEYILNRRLGKGAFAQVHLAHKVSDGSPVAVKITDLSPSQKEEKEKAVFDHRAFRNVLKEAKVLKMVRAEEHCVAFHEVYQEGPLAYMVMERCDTTLLQAIESSPELTENSLRPIFKEMFMALQCIHKVCIIHRDVKPDNFLCTGKDSTVKLCDFGLAEVLPHPCAETKGVFGTAPFMSPEMLGPSGYGTPADVWSLGVLIYVMLFGNFPYVPVEASGKAMKAAILAGVPEPKYKTKGSLDDGPGYLSPDTIGFLQPLLDRNKKQRPTAEEVLQMPWLSRDREPDQLNLRSLRPVLNAAKRSGAFEPCGRRHEAKTNVDVLLSTAQATNDDIKRRPSNSSSKGKICKANAEFALEAQAMNDDNKRRPSNSSTKGKICKANAEFALEVHRAEKMDPAMVQSYGTWSIASRSTATGVSGTAASSNSKLGVSTR